MIGSETCRFCGVLGGTVRQITGCDPVLIFLILLPPSYARLIYERRSLATWSKGFPKKYKPNMNTHIGKSSDFYNWCILQKLRWVKFFYRIFLMKMVKYPQTYPLIPKIPLGWSIKSKFWRILKCTFLHVKYVVQRFVPRDLIFWSFAYCLTISESSCQSGSTGTQIWAQNSMVN